jgi:hypothetical protein
MSCFYFCFIFFPKGIFSYHIFILGLAKLHLSEFPGGNGSRLYPLPQLQIT